MLLELRVEEIRIILYRGKKNCKNFNSLSLSLSLSLSHCLFIFVQFFFNDQPFRIDRLLAIGHTDIKTNIILLAGVFE